VCVVLPAAYASEVVDLELNKLCVTTDWVVYTVDLSCLFSAPGSQFSLIWVELVQPRFMPQLLGTLHFSCEVAIQTHF
jgi:hypothetical protein